MLPKPSWFTAMSTHIHVRMRVRAGAGMTARVYPVLRWSASPARRMIGLTTRTGGGHGGRHGKGLRGLRGRGTRDHPRVGARGRGAGLRLLLGIGSPNPQALARVRDGVAAIRKSLTTRVIVAALGPKMCELAGQVADGVLFNWLTPEYARRSAELVRAGAKAAGRPMPRTYAYVRVALGPAAAERLNDEGGRYAAIPAYGAHFARMGVKPVDTAIAATSPEGIRTALAAWRGAVDEVVLRAIVAHDTVEDHLTLLRAI